MNSLVISDSLYGNTKKVADAMADKLGTDSKAISDVRVEELKNLNFLIVGTPTHGGRPSEKMTEFIASIPEKGLAGVKVAAFDTGIPVQGQKVFLRFVIKTIGYAAPRLAKALEQKGARVVAAETFFVSDKEGPLKEGELERAREWVKTIS